MCPGHHHPRPPGPPQSPHQALELSTGAARQRGVDRSVTFCPRSKVTTMRVTAWSRGANAVREGGACVWGCCPRFTGGQTEAPHREVQGHTARKCLSWDSNPLPDPRVGAPQGPGCPHRVVGWRGGCRALGSDIQASGNRCPVTSCHVGHSLPQRPLCHPTGPGGPSLPSTASPFLPSCSAAENPTSCVHRDPWSSHHAPQRLQVPWRWPGLHRS